MQWKRRHVKKLKLPKRKKKKGQDKMPRANPFQGAFVKEIIYI